VPALDVVPLLLPGRGVLLERLARTVGRTFGVTWRLREPGFDAESAFEPHRGQYRATRLLRLLLDHAASEDGPILGVAGVDLCTPILSYVFGEAQLDGRAAVVSIHRLRPEAYGLPRDDGLLFERLLKEAVHELGHVYGLVHCPEPSCVMRVSTYVEEIDLKSALPCPTCLERIRRG
jgi:archaemetzincin